MGHSTGAANLALRFILEIAALFALGFWGWAQHEGVLRYALTIGLPLVSAVLWATFRVPDDTSGGPPIVPVRGVVRLLLEVAFFSLATWGLVSAGATRPAWIFGALVLIHYLVSYDRLRWLLRQ